MFVEKFEKSKLGSIKGYVKQGLIKYKKIPFIKLIKFSFKSLIKEVLFYVLNIATLVISIIVGALLAFSSSGASQVILFNFFILFYICCLMFVFILRMVQFFFNKNFQDKTTYIVLTNQVSRTKFFLAQHFLIIVILVVNIFSSFLVINLSYGIFTLFKYDIFILKMSLLYSAYAILATFFLTNFIIFLIFIFSLQTTTIICTLLLALSFIANIPMSFVKANEKSYNIAFEDGQVFKLNDIYDAYTLHDNIAEGNIKYKHLSKYVYDTFINNSLKLDDFSNKKVVETRIKMWSDLGLIDKNPVIIGDENIKLLSKPLRDKTVPETWKSGDEFNIQLTLDNTFISELELDVLISQTTNKATKNILIDFKDFTNEINQHFRDKIQLEKHELIHDFLFLELGEESSYLKKTSDLASEETTTYALKQQDIRPMYEYTLLGRNSDGFRFSNTDRLITKDLNFNLMYTARVFEQYFIKYSSNYIMMSSNAINTSSGDWKTYTSGRSSMRLLSYFNLYSGLWMFYTSNLGFYYQDVWFAPDSESKIYLEDQKNLFLGYPEYDLKVNSQGMIDENTTSNYIKPWYYITILLVISLASFIIALYKFRKFDFN